MKNKQLKYVSLFSGGGVGLADLKKIGFKCICTNELIERRLEVQRQNKICDESEFYVAGDIRNKDVKHQIHSLLKEQSIDLLIATPPCQGMSVANHKKNSEDLARNSLVLESINIIKKYKPRTFLLENVRGFMKAICTDNDKQNKSIDSVINNNLSKIYKISYKIINLGHYGANSSRTRCLVIGSLKSNLELNTEEMFPDPIRQKTLKELIGHLPRLKKMGSYHKDDLLHNFKSYEKLMEAWIEKTSPGESAFDQKDKTRIPHRFKNGKKIFVKNKNSDKYKRCAWDKPMPCIHTRNDILASQATIHPEDNRVFSIRELMILMNIPNNFRWFPKKKRSKQENIEILRKNEINIRQCIGEGVPTIIFSRIGEKIKDQILTSSLTMQELNKVKSIYNHLEDKNWKIFRKLFFKDHNFFELSRLIEFFNSSKNSTAAFYTRSDISRNIVKDLPKFTGKKYIRILEPSVGAGSFIPFLLEKYKNKNVTLDLIDIDKSIISLLKHSIKKLDIPTSFKINFFNENFLSFDSKEKYDLIITNPPFGKTPIEIYNGYKNNSDIGTRNQFALFIHKAYQMGNYLCFITPKSLLSTPEFNLLRQLLGKSYLCSINDFGEKAFKGVLIETISIMIRQDKNVNKSVKVNSLINNSSSIQHQHHIQDKKFPCWLIYRTDKFENILKKLNLDIFDFIRDREITKKHTTKKKTSIRVLKSRNVANNKVVKIDGYDSYLIDGKSVKALNHMNQYKIMIPNLTYYPRACYLPKKSICDGSIALLTPKKGYIVTDEDLDYFASDEFKYFYHIARNKGTRSLNIDKNSIIFWGIKKNIQRRLI